MLTSSSLTSRDVLTIENCVFNRLTTGYHLIKVSLMQCALPNGIDYSFIHNVC